MPQVAENGAVVNLPGGWMIDGDQPWILGFLDLL